MILAADLADDREWRPVNRGAEGITGLSSMLRSASFHPRSGRNDNFRSENSVALKVNNLIASHPSKKGVGARTSAAERPVVERFLANRSAMKRVASRIRERVRQGAEQEGDAEIFYREETASVEANAVERLERPEPSGGGPGGVCQVDDDTHAFLVGRAVVQGESLDCTVCGFDFERVYGKAGHGYIEVHRSSPSPEVSRVKSDDVMVCANCHRMLHRGTGMTVENLRSAISS